MTMNLLDPVRFATLRANTQAIEILKQANTVKAIYSDMEEIWLHLYTKDKKCPIVEEIGTIVKRRLVRQYSVELIKRVRATMNFDLATMVIEPDQSYWVVDDIVHRIADGKVEDHYHFFCLLVNAIFGLSIRIMDVMFKETITLGDLSALLNDIYILTVNDPQEDAEITVESITTRLEDYLIGEDLPIFEVTHF